jgi:Rrf2 family protein
MLSKTSQYALRSLFYLALESDVYDKKGVSEIAERLSIPRHFLAKILQRLATHRMIHSVKGSQGGFYFAEDVDADLKAVVKLFDGDQIFEGCILGLPACNEKEPCPLHTDFRSWRAQIREGLFTRKVSSIAKTLKRDNIKI